MTDDKAFAVLASARRRGWLSAAVLERVERVAEREGKGFDPLAYALRAGLLTRHQATLISDEIGAGEALAATSIPFTCPACGQSTQVPADLAGKTVKCPHCDVALRAPAPGSASDRPRRDREPRAADRSRHVLYTWCCGVLVASLLLGLHRFIVSLPREPETVLCTSCGGHKYITIRAEYWGERSQTIPCPACRGSGRIPR